MQVRNTIENKLNQVLRNNDAPDWSGISLNLCVSSSTENLNTCVQHDSEGRLACALRVIIIALNSQNVLH